MRILKFLFFLALLFSCQKKEDNTKSLTVNYQELKKNSIGLVTYKDVLFTGKANRYQSDGKTLKAIYNYVEGLKDGEVKRWYDNGVLNYKTSYVKGRKQGEINIWYKNGQLQKSTTYFKGVVHGVENTWYSSGEKFKTRNLVYGREKGMQQGWRKNGKLYANYQAVNGRFFGLRGANMCYKLESEKVVK